jgi:hypothetical protein
MEDYLVFVCFVLWCGARSRREKSVAHSTTTSDVLDTVGLMNGLDGFGWCFYNFEFRVAGRAVVNVDRLALFQSIFPSEQVT